MSSAQLIPFESDGCPFLFFNEQVKKEQIYKIYNDGGHYIATTIFYSAVKHKGYNKSKQDIDILFDSLYNKACADGLNSRKTYKPMADFIRNGILKLFPQYPKLDEFIEDKIKRKINNLHHRKKRFRRKASLNRWNYFVTFTYDDKKQTEETFKKRLRKCLANFHTRRGWKYMGVFERAPETGRLHFHGLLYVPDGEMVGNLTEMKDYSTTDGKMQTRHENDFFEKAFGRNDFDEVTETEMKNGLRQEYILKYIGKTGERIVYSRGIPSEIFKKLTVSDIVTEMQNEFVQKYILFDNVIDWERDVMRYRYNRQMTVIDLICNSPHVA